MARESERLKTQPRRNERREIPGRERAPPGRYCGEGIGRGAEVWIGAPLAAG